MLKLREGTVLDASNNEIFLELFLQKLPITFRTALSIHKDFSLSALADMADNVAELQGPQAPVYQLHTKRSEKHCSCHHDQYVYNNRLAPNLAFVGITSDLARKP